MKRLTDYVKNHPLQEPVDYYRDKDWAEIDAFNAQDLVSVFSFSRLEELYILVFIAMLSFGMSTTLLGQTGEPLEMIGYVGLAKFLTYVTLIAVIGVAYDVVCEVISVFKTVPKEYCFGRIPLRVLSAVFALCFVMYLIMPKAYEVFYNVNQ